MPPKMIARMTFLFSSVKPGTTHVLGSYQNSAVLGFDLELEELLDKQHSKQMIKEVGKVKLDVNKMLLFLNERMRF